MWCLGCEFLVEIASPIITHAVHTFVLKQRDTAYMYIISSTEIISVCTLINPSLYKDAEEKVECGNHTSLQDVAVTVCVHKGSMYMNQSVYKYRYVLSINVENKIKNHMHCFARQCFEDIQLEKSTASRFRNKIVYKKKNPRHITMLDKM